MKKIYNVMMLAAVAAAALVSCAKEMDKTEVGPQGEGIKVTVVTGNEVETKTALSGANTVAWRNGEDVLGLVNKAAAEKVQTSAAVVNGSGQATFNATVTNAGTFFAYYPYTSRELKDGNRASVRIEKEQNLTGTSFDPMADLLVSESFNVDAGGYTVPTTLKFKRLGAFLKVYFDDQTDGNKLAGNHVRQVTVQSIGEGGDESAGQPLVGAPIFDSDGIFNPAGGYKTVIGNIAKNTFSISNDAHAAYLGIIPATLPANSQLKITAVMDDYTFSRTITLSKAISIASGDIQPIKVVVHDADITARPKSVTVEKLWQKLSTAGSNWFAAIGGSAENDFNIAIDDQNVYIPEFGGSKHLWAIDIATGETITSVNTSTVESVGYNNAIYLSCARVVKKNDGTPVLMASNLFSDNNGRLYIWNDGINNAPAVKTLTQYSAGRRLGDTWTTYGNFEDCWMIMGTQEGGSMNGFVTMRVPTGASAGVISRLATTTGDFCSYYPFPGDLLHGMFTWRGGTHDDGMAYRNRFVTINSTEEAIKTEGAHAMTLSKLDTWMGNWENNNGSGFNFIEFNGKRYVIWVINMNDSKTFDIMIKEGSTETPWQTIIDTPAATITSAGGFAFRESLVGGQATTWKQGTDCAVWNNGDEVYIAVNKVNVGLAVYKLYLD